jgi:hypothetical protein
MKTLEIKQVSPSNLSLTFSPEILKANEDEFVAFIEDSIRLLQSQLLSIQESEPSL